MADRIKGITKFAGTFELEASAPLDARQYAETQADLLTTSNWTALDGAVYTYVGMMVAVHSDSTAGNNGIYILINADYTQLTSWLQVSGSGVVGGVAGYQTQFVNSDLVGGYLTVNHALNSLYNITSVSIMDNNGKKIEVDDVEYTNSNNLVLDLRMMEPIIGTWSVFVTAISEGIVPPVPPSESGSTFNEMTFNSLTFN